MNTIKLTAMAFGLAVANVFAQSAILEENGLRVPQIMKVMSELKRKGINVDTNAMTVEEGFSEIINLLSEK